MTLIGLRRRIATFGWFRGKRFTSDWTMWNLENWRGLLRPWRDRAIEILEIGSWEGRSAIVFLRLLPRARITCIDRFGKAAPAADGSGARSRFEARFDHNMAAFGSRVTKIKADSVPALDALIAAGRRFELIYVDGGHDRARVAEDSRRSWELLAPGGILIWDDYEWGEGRADDDRPKPAIDAFLAGHRGEYRLLSKGWQVAIERAG